MITNDGYDYWTEKPRTPLPEALPTLTVETIEDVVPLDSQFGVAEPLTVPEALQHELFGQPAPTAAAEIATHADDSIQGPQLQTYAILDAAKVTNLPEMLEASALPHRCLFKGEAYGELKDVAPWIVQIKDDHNFTRNLFTRSGAPWHLWDSEPGIYVRSRGTFDDLWTHFRKFTRIQDEKSRWYYVRFYDPAAAKKMLDQEALWAAIAETSTSIIIQSGNKANLLRNLNVGDRRKGPWLDFGMERRKELERRLVNNASLTVLALSIPGSEKANAELVAYNCMRRMMGYGFVNEKHLRIMATWELVFGHHYEQYDPEGTLLAICEDKRPALRRFKAFSKRMDQVRFQRLIK